ncbi:MAG TPA: hypothetical protein VGR62_23520 [Candidatus Binatia bacterium]|nr:hypothetical protein [Candidatus Binatia bacterium]
MIRAHRRRDERSPGGKMRIAKLATPATLTVDPAWLVARSRSSGRGMDSAVINTRHER